MSTKSDATISDLRLQTIMDMWQQKYIRERGDPLIFDTVRALQELKTTRAVLAKLRVAS